MMLLVLDKNPRDAAMKVPQKLKHKQLLELMQMISCVVDFGYKQIPQGKEIKDWISRNKAWTYAYAKILAQGLNLKPETRIKYECLNSLLYEECRDIDGLPNVVIPNARTAIFRYVKEYDGNTKYPTGSELPINVAVEEYEKYMNWKGNKWQ